MSIFPQMAAMLLKEHKYRPIEGNILLVGRQTVNLTVENALALIRSEGIIPRDDFQLEIDSSTIGYEHGTFITDLESHTHTEDISENLVPNGTLLKSFCGVLQR
jgi:hypothetical protein